ncbi:MAG: sulfite exporter TauE/SafE family protein [bacterium]
MIALYLFIGLTAGIASGLFGVGGGVLIVPALSLLAGFAQERAIGTSLAVLLPPVGLAAVLAYWKNDNVDWKAGFLIAFGLFIGAWLGAKGAHKMGDHWLKLCFGVFLTGLGIWVAASALKGVHLKDI